MNRVSQLLMPMLCLAISACVPEVGHPFQLQGSQQAILRQGVEITFVSVLEDSRCPQGAMCIWEGEARVALDVKKTGQPSPVRVELSTLPDKSSANVDGYRIELQRVDPYPELNRPLPPLEQYRVILLVTPAQQGPG
jgi:hypothetical protein